METFTASSIRYPTKLRWIRYASGIVAREILHPSKCYVRNADGEYEEVVPESNVRSEPLPKAWELRPDGLHFEYLSPHKSWIRNEKGDYVELPKGDPRIVSITDDFVPASNPAAMGPHVSHPRPHNAMTCGDLTRRGDSSHMEEHTAVVGRPNRVEWYPSAYDVTAGTFQLCKQSCG